MSIRAQDFEVVRGLALELAGIVLSEEKSYLVESRLRPLATQEGFEDFEALVGAAAQGNPDLEAKVVDALTTNETSFFRDTKVFDLLREDILPELLEIKRPARQLNIWCGASSSGQEPLSVAMLLHEHFPEVLSWDLNYFATDISDQMLERCRSATYSQLEVSRGLPASHLVQYFTQVGRKWVAKDSLRKLIQFKKMNLVQPFPTLPRMDLVMIRNVLIYFNDDHKGAVLQKTRQIMHDHSFLVLGSGEFVRCDGFRRVVTPTACYYRGA